MSLEKPQAAPVLQGGAFQSSRAKWGPLMGLASREGGFCGMRSCPGKAARSWQELVGRVSFGVESARGTSLASELVAATAKARRPSHRGHCPLRAHPPTGCGEGSRAPFQRMCKAGSGDSLGS